jgi:hypothetical protein
VVVDAIVYSAWFWLGSISPHVAAARAHSGFDAIITPGMPVAVIIFMAKLGAATGLFFVLHWGRVALACWLCGSLLMAAFVGTSFAVPLDQLLGYASSLLDGGLLAVSFSQPISGLFVNDPARA